MRFPKCIGMCLLLEQMIAYFNKRLISVQLTCSALKEEDLWSGLWQRRAHLAETVIGVAFEQQGFFEQAQGTYELAMTKVRQEFNSAPAPVSLQSEYRLGNLTVFLSLIIYSMLSYQFVPTSGYSKNTGFVVAKS